MVASAIIVLGLCGTGHTESPVPLVIKYELPFNEWTYASHSVTFAHSTHAMNYKIACIRCHHKLERGAIAVEKTCKDCHANTEMRSFPQAENIPKEKRMDYNFLAIHDQCINCHKEVRKKEVGKKEVRKSDEWIKAPVGCWRCHVYKKIVKGK
jgi:hypothetical protein